MRPTLKFGFASAALLSLTCAAVAQEPQRIGVGIDEDIATASVRAVLSAANEVAAG